MKWLTRILSKVYNQSFKLVLSYSSKIKLIIGLSSGLALAMIALLMALQAPLLRVLRQQEAAIAYYNALMMTIQAIEDPGSDTPSFDAWFTRLQDRESVLASVLFSSDAMQTQKLAALSATLKVLAQTIPFMSKNYRQETLVPILPEAIRLLVEEGHLPLGSGYLAYRIAYTLYRDMPARHSPQRLITPQLLALQIQLGATLQKIVQVQISTLLWRQWSCLVFFITGLSIVLLLSFARTMRAPLADFQQLAEQLASGQLKQRAAITSDDEVAKMGKAFNTMAGLLEQTVATTSLVAHKLQATMASIASSAQTFEQNFFHQDQMLAQIAHNTTGITKASAEVSKALQGSQQVANATKEFAITAQSNIHEVETILIQTALAARSIVDTLSDLEIKVTAVHRILDTLVNVADQANLLAINTALMAYTPSHKHSGFGTIAAKIRDLASQTAFITLNVEASIQAIIQALGESVSQTGLLSHQINVHSEAAATIIEQLRQMTASASHQVEIFDRMQIEIQQQENEAQQVHETISLLAQSAKIASRSVHALYTHIQYLGEAAINLEATLARFTTPTP